MIGRGRRKKWRLIVRSWEKSGREGSGRGKKGEERVSGRGRESRSAREMDGKAVGEEEGV